MRCMEGKMKLPQVVPSWTVQNPAPFISAGNTAETLSVAGHPPIVSLLITLKRERLDLKGSPFF